MNIVYTVCLYSADMGRVFVLLTTLFLSCDHGYCQTQQEIINYLASYIRVEYNVLDNLASGESFFGELIFEHTDVTTITDLTWSLYLSSFKDFEHESIYPDGADLGNSSLRVYHVNGYLFKIEPTEDFPGFIAGERLVVPFKARASQIEVAETTPNWYFVGPDAAPRVVVSTAGEDLSWVGPFDTPNKWKRSQQDMYNPYTAQDRFDLYDSTDLGFAPKLIVPTPVEEALDTEHTVNIDTGDWVVVSSDTSVRTEAEYLASVLGTVVVDAEFTPASRYVILQLGDVTDGDGLTISNEEAYRVDVIAGDEVINITGNNALGAFYGVQSLISLYEADVNIPEGYVVDFPRYQYRGLHVDVSRNFLGKDDILRYLDWMATYKMNKFHFHITDDEGWRLEIPDLPELTDIGSRRCHDLTGDFCLLPQLGSAPGLANDGTGHYSVSEYREILTYANDRHIQVIPEFNMPGHADAPVKTMLARYRKYIDVNETAATEYLLTDLNDNSNYISTQGFYNNSLNPCVESTYTFIKHVLREVIGMHADIQPLTTFNFGGDEVPTGAWVDSPACSDISSDMEVIKEYFVVRVAEIVHAQGLDISGWEDGFMVNGKVPYDISSMPNNNKYAYAWNNVFSRGTGQNAYLLANEGYKTILASATHIYFGHPYEPDPLDRGFYWATRLISNLKVFSFLPDSMYDNMGLDGNGVPYNRTEICQTYGCAPLEPGKEQNILGIQGHIWGENVRKPYQYDDMTFPRILVVAEKAWHKPSWEDIEDPSDRQAAMLVDWEQFSNTLGHKELARLDNREITYRINPAGARLTESNILEAKAEFPGLPLQYSTDSGDTWTDYTEGQVMSPGTVQVRVRSPDRSRSSRQVELNVNR